MKWIHFASSLSRGLLYHQCFILLFFLGLINPHAVQFTYHSVPKQQLKPGPEADPFKFQMVGNKWIWVRPLCYSCKPYLTEKPWIGGSAKVGKGASRMCLFVSESSQTCAYVCVFAVCANIASPLLDPTSRISRGSVLFPLTIANQFLRCSIQK